MLTWDFWFLSSEIIKMLDKQVSRGYLNGGKTVTKWRQKLEDQFPHLISDLQAVCFQKKPVPNDELILLVYESQYSHILQVDASHPASAFPLNVHTEADKDLCWIIKRLFTPHPLQQGLEFTGQHYTIVAKYFMIILDPP